MSQNTDLQQKWVVASFEVQDVYTDFILLLQAMLCSPKTNQFFHFTTGKFIKNLEDNGINNTRRRFSKIYTGLSCFISSSKFR